MARYIKLRWENNHWLVAVIETTYGIKSLFIASFAAYGKKADLEKRQSRRDPRGLDVDSQAQAGKYTKIPDPKNTQYLLNRFFDQFLDLGLQKPFFFGFFFVFPALQAFSVD